MILGDKRVIVATKRAGEFEILAREVSEKHQLELGHRMGATTKVTTNKASSQGIVSLAIQTTLTVVLYVGLVSAVCLLSTVIGGMMLQYGDGNVALPLHSLHLIAFRGYWIFLAVSFVAALARKWTRTLSNDLYGNGDYDLFDAVATFGSIAAMVFAIVCLVGYTTIFDFWMALFGNNDAAVPTKGTYLFWAVVMLIVTIFECVASNKFASVFAGGFETFELRRVIACAIAPVFSLAIAAIGLVAVGCVLGLIGGAVLIYIGVPLFIGLCLFGVLMSR